MFKINKEIIEIDGKKNNFRDWQSCETGRWCSACILWRDCCDSYSCWGKKNK